MSLNELLVTTAESVFSQYIERYPDIEVLSLATTDGFPVFNMSSNHVNMDDDKMAAASSTLYSVSNAVSKQLLEKSFKITYIEAEQGNVGFISLSIQDKDFVLAMSTSESMNLGQLRVFINRIANEILQSAS